MAHTPKPNEIILADDADRAVDAFEQVLGRHGIEIRKGSLLEHSCLLLKRQRDLAERAASDSQTPITMQFRRELQEATGIMAPVRLIVRHAEHPDFGQLVPHLKLLNEGSVLQTLPADYMDKASNKLFELRIALAAMGTGREILVDDPDTSSGGNNPDVLARMLDGLRWGFACKVINGDAPMTLFENIEKGVDQIERSDCDVGLVLLSLKNRLPHEEIFPVLETHKDGIVVGAHLEWENARNAMSRAFNTRLAAMIEHAGADHYVRLFKGKKALPAVACALEAVTASFIEGVELPVQTVISFLHVAFVVPLPDEVLAVLVDLGDGWQNK
ncbi:MAG: hypothetical protein ABL886_05455 [Rhodoglobus sp.]